MQHDKKQLEILLMQYFRESYNDFPKGIIKPSESPDFIINFKNNHQLGIELTRLNPGNAIPLNEKHQHEIDIQEHFIELAKDLFEQSSGLKLFVKFLFSNKNKLTAEQEILTAIQIVAEIRKSIQQKNPESFFIETIEGSQLPEVLESVLIVNHPALEFSVWERSNNLGVSNNVVDDIKNAIHKKDEKLKLYQKQRLNYYWLLITTDRLRGVKNYNLPNKVMNHTFRSNFQRVFLFDLVKSEVFELV